MDVDIMSIMQTYEGMIRNLVMEKAALVDELNKIRASRQPDVPQPVQDA